LCINLCSDPFPVGMSWPDAGKAFFRVTLRWAHRTTELPSDRHRAHEGVGRHVVSRMGCNDVVHITYAEVPLARQTTPRHA